MRKGNWKVTEDYNREGWQVLWTIPSCNKNLFPDGQLGTVGETHYYHCPYKVYELGVPTGAQWVENLT